MSASGWAGEKAARSGRSISPHPWERTSKLGMIIEKDEGRSRRAVKGKRSNRRWAPSSAQSVHFSSWQKLLGHLATILNPYTCEPQHR